jgi:hypothetical protein
MKRACKNIFTQEDHYMRVPLNALEKLKLD